MPFANTLLYDIWCSEHTCLQQTLITTCIYMFCFFCWGGVISGVAVDAVEDVDPGVDVCK